MLSPKAADEPHQQEEPEPWSQTGQTSKQAIDDQRNNQDGAAPPLVSQISPHVAAHHHSWKTGAFTLYTLLTHFCWGKNDFSTFVNLVATSVSLSYDFNVNHFLLFIRETETLSSQRLLPLTKRQKLPQGLYPDAWSVTLGRPPNQMPQSPQLGPHNAEEQRFHSELTLCL